MRKSTKGPARSLRNSAPDALAEWLSVAMSLSPREAFALQAARCSASSFTGGHVVMTQYPRDGFDANYLCRS